MKDFFFDKQLVKKYDVQCPRYTSYPTAIEFNAKYSINDYLLNANKNFNKPLSLYFHIPFCQSLCYFCGCNKVITKNKEKAVYYLEMLYREISLQSKLFGQRQVKQLHLGGGTPTFLTANQLEQLFIAV